VTNRLGCIDGDFEKGESNGARGAIDWRCPSMWRFHAEPAGSCRQASDQLFQLSQSCETA
jgi:hypothetical protein